MSHHIIVHIVFLCCHLFDQDSSSFYGQQCQCPSSCTLGVNGATGQIPVASVRGRFESPTPVAHWVGGRRAQAQSSLCVHRTPHQGAGARRHHAGVFDAGGGVSVLRRTQHTP